MEPNPTQPSPIENLPVLESALFQIDPLSKLPHNLASLYVLKGIIYSLVGNPNQVSVNLLERATIYCPYAEIQNLSLSQLAKLAEAGNTFAKESLFHLVIEFNSPQAYDLLISSHFKSDNPETQAAYYLIIGDVIGFSNIETPLTNLTKYFSAGSQAVQKQIIHSAEKMDLVNWVAISKIIAEPNRKNYYEIIDRFKSFNPEEKNILFELINKKITNHEISAIDVICDIYLGFLDSSAKEIILEHRCAPEDPIKRALVYFLTEQWEKYDQTDINYTYISIAYETSSGAIRKILLELSRYSGRMEWFSSLSGSNRLRLIADLNDDEWNSVIKYLDHTDKFEQIWYLAQNSPAYWSSRLLIALDQHNWSPKNLNTDETFQYLVQYAKAAVSHPIEINKIRRISIPDGNNTCLSLSPSGRRLAVGRLDSNIFLGEVNDTVNIKDRALIGVSPTSRAIQFSYDEEYLISANSDHQIYIYLRSDQILVKKLSGHTNFIRNLHLSSDDRYLISTGFDGFIRIWRFPMGSEYNKIQQPGGEIYCSVYIPEDKELFVSTDDKIISIWNIYKGEYLGVLEEVDDVIIQLAISQNSQFIVGYSKSHKIFIWNLKSRHLLKCISLHDHPERITAICLHEKEQILAVGNESGAINLINLSTHQKLTHTEIKKQTNQITGLCFINEGNHLISSSLDGSLFEFDLSLYLLVKEPVGNLPPQRYEEVKNMIESGNLSSNERPWLEFVRELLHLRQQYDIQISEDIIIDAGEFDIQL